MHPQLAPQPLFPNEWHWKRSWYEFRVSLAVPFEHVFQHYNFIPCFAIFSAFYKNVLAAAAGSMVAKDAFMFENCFFWLVKETEKVQIWG